MRAVVAEMSTLVASEAARIGRRVRESTVEWIARADAALEAPAWLELAERTVAHEVTPLMAAFTARVTA